MGKPKVRFKGYTDDWEQRKFADFTWDAGKRNREDLDLEPYAITNEHGFIRQRDAHDDFGYMKDTDRKAYNIVQPNSFAYNPARINVGSIGYYKGVENVIVSSLYEVFQTDNYVNDRFLWHWFKSDEFPRWIERLQEGSVRLYFYYDKLCECRLYMPSLEEQEKIASFLDALDRLITLHQRKCENAQKLKKYMLQKMFPKNGTNVPEIRFEGFKDAWEQRKLKEIADKVSEKNKNNEFSEPFTNSAEQGIISQKDYFDREIVNNENLDGYYIVRNDDFIYNPRISVTAPVGPINRNRLGRNGVMSPLYTVFRTHDIDNLYLEFYFKTTKWHRFMKLNGDSGARFDRFTISSTQFMEMPIPYPTLDEQQKIGKYFDSLDHLITLHQHKCEELKNIKKFMLQNMFVQEK